MSMGTVPDPLRSAKLSLITVSEEKNGLGELPSSKCQHKQASIERNSNGYPFSAKVQPTGEQLSEVNCVAEASVPRVEQPCEYDTSHTSMSSPGSLSPSKEGCLATLEIVNKTKQGASNDSKGQILVQSPSLEHATLKAPVTQEAKDVGQSHGGELLCSATDKVSSPSEVGASIVKSKLHDPLSLPYVHPDTQQDTPAVKKIVDRRFGSKKNGASASAKVLEPVSNLGLKTSVCLDATLMDTNSHPNPRTVPESVPKSKSENTSQPSFSNETTLEAIPELSKFTDRGTMTVQPGGRSANEDDVSKTCQDAEVQAVASMESKSASTSPSIFAAFLKENMLSEAKQNQDQLHIIYTGANGKEQSKIVDNFAQKAPSTGIMPEVHIQAPAAAKKKLEAQVVKPQDGLSGIMDEIHSASLDKAEHPCPLASGHTPKMSVKGMEVETAGVARYHSSLPQQMVDSSVLQIRPVYQISVHTTSQPLASSHPMNIGTTLPLCSALPEVKSKHHHIGISATEGQATSLSCHKGPEEVKTLPSTAGVHDSRQGEQLQIKTVSDLVTGLSSFHVDAKPNKEDNIVHPDPKGQEMSKTTATAVAPARSQATCPPFAVQKEQGRFGGTPKETETLGSHSLAVELESKLSSNSAQDLEIKNNEMRKGPKLSLAEAPASIQPMTSLCEKKKESKSEAKVHLKQSKHVRDVVWDEQGMTWEVYGASLDPESLGIAIQNHLQRQIREHEKLIKAQNTQTRKSISSDTSSNKKLKGRQHNVFQSVLQNFRRPNCCVRPAASSVLD